MSGLAAEAPDPVTEKKKELMMLQAQRDALELEASVISSELNSPGPNGEAPVGVRGSLVDSDGFPLAGFDLFNVREKRHRLNCIQTDHKAVMSKLEKALHALHEAQAVRRPASSYNGAAAANGTPRGSGRGVASATGSGSAGGAGTVNSTNAIPLLPLAKVNEVSGGSPAASAGLAVGDLVLRFGSVDISHPKGMGGVVDVVRENEGREVLVTVLRHGGMEGQSGVKELKLVPRTWAGRGLLGVHLLPP